MFASKNSLQGTLLVGSILTTLIIVPFSYDPISAPKLFTLVSLATICLVMLVSLSGKRVVKEIDFLDKLMIVFVLLLIFVLCVNQSAWTERIFGIAGRSTGFLTFLAFTVILFVSRRSILSLSSFYASISITNFFVSLYFFTQYLGFDIGSFQEYYAAPSSTLGNPNFVSGFIGFSCLAIFGAVGSISRNKRLVLVIPYLLLSLWVIYESDSVQGFVAFGLTSSILIFYWLYVNFSIKAFVSVFVLSLAPSSIAILGFFGFGPLSSLLSSTTVFSRLDYWRAAVAMTFDRPLFGQGFDAFGDNYRRFRDGQAFARFGESQVSDSAHNVFLDVFVNGGIPLGTLFIFLNLLPVVLLFKQIKVNHAVTRDQVILLSLWSGFQVQALVSPNQIGVSIWIWLILGAMAKKRELDSEKKEDLSKVIRIGKNATLSTLIVFIFSLISFLPLRANIDFLDRGKGADGLGLKQIALRFPQDSKLIGLVALGFQNSNFPGESLAILKEGVVHNPESFTLWRLIYENPEATVKDKSKAKSEMLRLEPRMIFPNS